MDGIEEVVEPVETGLESTESTETVETQPNQQEQEEEGEYGPKSSREYTQWLKALREADPNNVKWASLSKNNHSRLYQLSQLEPKGLDGVREKYATLDGISFGEAKGIDAIGALQDYARETAQVDELLAAGDPKVLEQFGEEFNDGLAKLAPSILDRIQQSHPEAYANAVLPHFVNALRSSPLVENFNGMVDVLNEGMPSWLPDDKKEAWAQDKMARIMGLAGNMGKWLNTQADKVKDYKPGQPQTAKPDDKFTQERQQFEDQKRQHFWNTEIAPKTDTHATKTFEDLYRPYAQRLKLDGARLNNFKHDFVNGVVGKATAKVNGKDNPYMQQIRRYHSQNGVSPDSVANYVNVEFTKHAASIFKNLVDQRYGSFLGGQSKTQTQTTQPGKPNPAANGPQVVGTKPASSDINWKATTPEMIHKKQYRLFSGKVVQVRA